MDNFGKLSVYEYFKCLQTEYIKFELRLKIYPKGKDRDYFKKVLKLKKNDIEDIALKNRIPSIFNDVKTKYRYYTEFFPTFGFPNITYLNKKEEKEFKYLDRKHYYREGEVFKTIIDKEIRFGKLKTVSNKANSVILLIDDQSHFTGIDNISRIL